MPVYKDNPDNIVGIVNMKDLLNLSINKGLLVLQDIIYSATFIPSSKKVAGKVRTTDRVSPHRAQQQIAALP